MSAQSIEQPYPIFTDADGDPLENGYIWIGVENLNPITDPVAVYWDEGLTQPAVQPIRTQGGYPVNNGTPAALHVAGAYSILAQDRNGITVYSAPSETVLTSSSAVTFLQAGTGAVTRTAQAKMRESVSVKDFGAVGDGITNDTDAFLAASAYINSQDGGKLVIPAGTYIVGKQTFAGSAGLGYAYLGSNVIDINNCTNPVVLEFQGAKLKMAPGLKFGSFDPATGAVFNPVMPFVNTDYQASLGIMVKLFQNANVSIIGSVELDGNISAAIVGGLWGDTGRQIVSYGVWAYNNDICTIENVWSHHHCLDGMASGYDGITTEAGVMKPLVLTGCVFENNARQGWSVTGGRGVTAIGCKFNNTGKDVPFASSPGAGCDLEAEGGWIRDVSFIDCEFSNNTGVGLVADSGDTAAVTAIRCRFIGTTSASIWPRKPRMSFYDCLIVGSSVNAFDSATAPDDATKFFNCKFSDEVTYSPTGSVYNSTFLVNFEAGDNVVLDGCNLTATTQRVLNIKGSFFVRDCTFVCSAGTAYIPNQDYVALMWTGMIENLTILDQITVGIPADGYFVSFSSTQYKGTNFTSGSKIKWWSWSAGAGGAPGYLGQNNPRDRADPFLAVVKGAGAPFLGLYGTADTYWWTAAPTTGTYKRGDRVFNSEPTVGQPKSWACTVAGTPGTWVSEGNL